MTYSIVAWDEATGMTGVAVATCHLAVGSLVPHARSGVGAIATQANTNPYLGYWGLERLEQLQSHGPGESAAADVLESLLQDDPGRDGRQVQIVDALGGTAAWTGPGCAGHAGHLCFEGYSVAGNYLRGREPLEAMARAFREAMGQGLPFEQRLLRAIEACEKEGGDVRGRQSASLLVMHRERYPLFDFRVDHHPDPVGSLKKILLQTQKRYYTDFRATLPTDSSICADPIVPLLRPRNPHLEPVSDDHPTPHPSVATIPTPSTVGSEACREEDSPSNPMAA